MAFRFESEARLYQYLGEYDALVQLEEVAIRRFVAAIEAAPDQRKFVISEARAYGINVTVAANEELMRNASRTNIVVAYQSADQFLEEYRLEHEMLHGASWNAKHDDVSAMDHAIRSLGVSTQEAIQEVGALRLEVFDYYRLVRNLATHRYDPDGEGRWNTPEARVGQLRCRLDSKLTRLSERFETELAEFRGRLNAPKGYDDLDFDDFVMATRNIKHIATQLSRVGQPSDERLLDALEEATARFLRHTPRNPDRVRRRIATEARHVFGVDEAHAERIASCWKPPAR